MKWQFTEAYPTLRGNLQRPKTNFRNLSKEYTSILLTEHMDIPTLYIEMIELNSVHSYSISPYLRYIYKIIFPCPSFIIRNIVNSRILSSSFHHLPSAIRRYLQSPLIRKHPENSFHCYYIPHV